MNGENIRSYQQAGLLSTLNWKFDKRSYSNINIKHECLEDPHTLSDQIPEELQYIYSQDYWEVLFDLKCTTCD